MGSGCGAQLVEWLLEIAEECSSNPANIDNKKIKMAVDKAIQTNSNQNEKAIYEMITN